MANDHRKLQDLMDRVGRPKFGEWTSSQEMADQAMAVYTAQGLTVDPDRVQDFSLDVFNGVTRLPLTLPDAYVTPKEERWSVVGGLGLGLCFVGMIGLIGSIVGFGLFGPGRTLLDSSAFQTLSQVFIALNGVGLLGLVSALVFEPGDKEKKRRGQQAMRTLLSTSSVSAIEDLLREPNRTPDVEALAWEELRRRKLREGPPQVTNPTGLGVDV